MCKEEFWPECMICYHKGLDAQKYHIRFDARDANKEDLDVYICKDCYNKMKAAILDIRKNLL